LPLLLCKTPLSPKSQPTRKERVLVGRWSSPNARVQSAAADVAVRRALTAERCGAAGRSWLLVRHTTHTPGWRPHCLLVRPLRICRRRRRRRRRPRSWRFTHTPTIRRKEEKGLDKRTPHDQCIVTCKLAVSAITSCSRASHNQQSRRLSSSRRRSAVRGSTHTHTQAP
jgi:hypothetical protein